MVPPYGRGLSPFQGPCYGIMQLPEDTSVIVSLQTFDENAPFSTHAWRSHGMSICLQTRGQWNRQTEAVWMLLLPTMRRS